MAFPMELVMNVSKSRNPVKTVLTLDGVTCLLMGLLLIVAGERLANLTDIPNSILKFSGVALLPIAVFMFVTSWKWSNFAVPVWLVIIGNFGWVIGSFALVAVFIQPNSIGLGFIVLQATAVLGFALLEVRAAKHLNLAMT
jgi:hypothetical protein